MNDEPQIEHVGDFGGTPEGHTPGLAAAQERESAPEAPTPAPKKKPAQEAK